MQEKYKAHIAVALANLFYGINFIVMKNLVPHVVLPFTLNLLRIIGATVLFWCLYAAQPKRESFTQRNWLDLCICAATGIIINQIAFVKGVALTTPFRASLLMMFSPIAVVFLALYVQKQKIHKSKALGFLLGVLGAIILISLREKTAAGENHVAGDLLIILNALSYAFYLVWVKRLTNTHSDLTVIRWIFTISLVALLPFGYSNLTHTNWAALTRNHYIALGFIIVCVTFFTYLFNTYSIRILGSSVTGAYIYTQPFFAATIFIYITGNTSFWALKLLAAALIFVGLYFVTKPAKQKNDDPLIN